MPIMQKEFELTDGQKILVRQASGLEKLKIEAIQAKAFRKCRDFGANPAEWTPEQHEEFSQTLEEMGGGLEAQMREWVPPCILTENIDANILTSTELRELLGFVRGDDEDGAVPLDN